MARNGSGTFVLPAGQPVVTGTTISSTTFNTLTSDLANALTQSIASDGQTTPTANLPMGGYKHTGVGNGSARTDYPSFGQLQDGVATWLASVSGVDTITASLATPALAAYAAGQAFRFVSAGANTTSVTLNINSVGAKNLTKDGTVALAAGDIPNGAVVTVVYDGTQFQLQNVSLSAQRATQGLTNRIINGGFRIDQRNVGAAQAAIATGSYMTDRWKYAFVAPTAPALIVTAQQSTTVPSAPTIWRNSQAITVTQAHGTVAASDYAWVQQNIEGYNVTDLIGQTFALQFWVRSPKTGTHCVALVNSGGDRSYVMEYSVSSANTWQQVLLTVPGGLTTAGTWSYTTGLGLVVRFTLMAGSNFQTTANAWNTTSGVGAAATSAQVNVCDSTSSFYLTGVQLYLGTSCPAYEERSFTTEVSLCQRYYQKSYGLTSAPGALTSSNTLAAGAIAATSQPGLQRLFQTLMRSAPTMNFYSGTTGASGNVRNSSTSADVAVSSVAQEGVNSTGIPVLASSPTAGNILYAHFTADADL